MNEKFWLDERKMQTRWGLLGSGLVNLFVLVALFGIFWTVFMNPKGLMRMYTPMFGCAYEQWFFVAVLLTALVCRFWPLNYSALERWHPVAKGAVLYALNVLFALFMVNIFFNHILGVMGVPYFSEDKLLQLRINPYNSREYASTAILMVGAISTLVIPIWSLHWYNWPEREIQGVSAKLTSFLLIMFFVTVGYLLLLHPHFGIIFHPWQVYTSAYPWWEKFFHTLSGNFNLGWIMAWTAAIWFIHFTWEGYPIKLVTKQPWRGIVGILFTFLVGMLLFAGFHLLADLRWGPAIRGAKLVMAVDWRYLHSGETAMFMLVCALILGIYFGNWPTRFATEVNILIRCVIVGIATLGLYSLYYKVSPTLLGTVPAYSHPQQFPLGPLSIFIALMLSHTWYFDLWPGEKAVRPTELSPG